MFHGCGGKHELQESSAVPEGVQSPPKEPGHDKYDCTYEQDRNEQAVGAQSCCLGDEGSRADQDEESYDMQRFGMHDGFLSARSLLERHTQERSHAYAAFL